MFEPVNIENDAVIKVIGIGGGGSNAVEHMIREKIEGVEFFAVNTDAQALRQIEVGQIIQIGNNITKGLGAGANPDVGRTAAEEDTEKLKVALEGADMIFIAAGMGGGTGTGAAPIIAKIARELGILTVAVVTKPFSFEGKKRMIFAEQGLHELAKSVDSLITIPNDKLLKVLTKGISLLDAFKAANDILKGAVQGIAELITRPGLMNVDFADVRTVMSEMGYAMMGTGSASGENRAEEASEIAISSPLLEDIDLSGTKGVLVNITAGFDLRLDEFETVGNTIRAFSSDSATVVIGTSLDPKMEEFLRVTVVATGIGADQNSEMIFLDNKKSRETLLGYQNSVATNKQKIKNSYTEKTIKEKNITSNNRLERNFLDIPAFLRKKN
ncbi:cell division protein FtsZ [Buchnera aphidicola]|uniref:cell division protein FtsZ n=1 Tax=Buchnera aphidicola TaxID=9 RepID=UPI00094C7CD2|nr:cell division protein FtsZ [Buchnera aphidicola]